MKPIGGKLVTVTLTNKNYYNPFKFKEGNQYLKNRRMVFKILKKKYKAPSYIVEYNKNTGSHTFTVKNKPSW